MGETWLSHEARGCLKLESIEKDGLKDGELCATVGEIVTGDYSIPIVNL